MPEMRGSPGLCHRDEYFRIQEEREAVTVPHISSPERSWLPDHETISVRISHAQMSAPACACARERRRSLSVTCAVRSATRISKFWLAQWSSWLETLSSSIAT